MKKIGIVVFGAAIIVGVVIANFFSFGKMTGNLFNFSFHSGIKGSGHAASEPRDASGFKQVEVGGVFQVEITAQKDFSVQVDADDNLLQYIKTEVDGDVLKIEYEKDINSKTPIRVRISAPDIERIESSGASKITMADLKNSLLDLDSSGASRISVAGETARLNAQVSGASNIDADNLKAADADVDASGASRAYVNVTGKLKADASGASHVIYSGNPSNVEKESSGASSIKQK